MPTQNKFPGPGQWVTIIKMSTNKENNPNDVNGSPASGRGTSSGRLCVTTTKEGSSGRAQAGREQDTDPEGSAAELAPHATHRQATVRNQPRGSHLLKWTEQLRKDLWKSYIKSGGPKRGYRKRMKELFDQDHPGIHFTEQALASQIREITSKNLISAAVRIEIERLHSDESIETRNKDNPSDQAEETGEARQPELEPQPPINDNLDPDTEHVDPINSVNTPIRDIPNQRLHEQDAPINDLSDIGSDTEVDADSNYDPTEEDAQAASDTRIRQRAHDISPSLSEEEIEQENEADPIDDRQEEDLIKLERLYHQPEEIEVPNLKNTKRNLRQKNEKEVNKIIERIPTSDISETNRLLLAGAALVAQKCNVTIKKESTGPKKDPPWKHRIEKSIEETRKHLSWLAEWKRDNLKDEKKKETLEKKYRVRENGLNQTMETIKQRLSAKSSKIQRFEKRIKGFRQNKLFENNQKRLYSELRGESRQQEAPNAEAAKAFWTGIWGSEVSHNQDAPWLQSIKEKTTIEQEDCSISSADLRVQLKKTQNWKAPGPDGLQGYWLKAFPALQKRTAIQLNQCLREGSVPPWMTKGRTVLIQKDKSKGNEVSNYRPITCLPLMWKTLTGIINEKVYKQLDERDLLPPEQKGCRRGSRGTKDHLLLDKMITKQAKAKKKDLSMAWIDYKKAFDMVPHSWLKECMKIYGISPNIRRLIENSMETWTVILTSANKTLGEVKVRRGILQGDSLSPLLFVVALLPLTEVLNERREGYQLERTSKINHLLYMDDLKLYAKSAEEVERLAREVHTVSTDINMEFGISKCGLLNIKRGQVTSSEGIEMPDGGLIAEIEETGYKYLGVLEHDTILHTQMKDKVKSEYLKRVRLVLKSSLSGGNVMRAINSWAVPVIRYTAGILKWTQKERQDIDRKSRKLMTIYRALHPRDSTARIYVKRKEGGRGLLSIEECIGNEEKALSKYLRESDDPWMKVVWQAKVLKDTEDPENAKKRIDKERKSTWKEGRLNGQFLRQVDEIQSPESWNWLRRGELKKETEGMLIAAQDQALRTRVIQNRIDRVNITTKCRICKSKDETINHIISECSSLAQREYKRRHDKVCRTLHWSLSKKHQLKASERWYEHEPDLISESEGIKLLWDNAIQTDRVITARRPDIVLIDKKERTVQIIDVAVPFDSRIVEKEAEKILKYQDLKIELTRIWQMRVEVIPIVIGALGTMPKDLDRNLKKIGCNNIHPGVLQKSVLLGTAHIIRKVLGA